MKTQKDSEKSLVMSVMAVTVGTALVWFGLVSFGFTSLWNLRKLPVVAATQPTVPTLDQDKIEELKVALKKNEPINLPINRPEPFD